MRDEYEVHLDQAQEWSAGALDARDAGDDEEVRACLHEARAWASHANVLRDAAELLARKLSAARLRVKAKAGIDGKLFGSITAVDVATAAEKQANEERTRAIIDGQKAAEAAAKAAAAVTRA